MKTFFLFCTLFLGYILSAQEVKFSFDKQKILLGEPLKMTIDAVIGAGQHSDLFSIDTLPHFEVLDQGKIDTSTQGGTLRLKQIVLITSWDSGSWQLPAVIRNGKAEQPVTIEVSYTSPWDPKQPYHDIKGISPVKDFSKTTDDLSIQLQKLQLQQPDYNNLVQTLRLSDLVKFAQYGPAEQINTDAFQTIKQSITTIEGRNAV
ncbi:MAG: hypothetical protein EON98_14160 [Chitinophagaceae bacterium]|nr:MAG: hypothetical protein EON98_14160 [Chitinophagaceae bacterium]